MSVLKAIIDNMKAGILADVDLTSTGDVRPLTANNISIRYRAIGTDRKGWARDEPTPGIIISPGRRFVTPSNLGNNKEDIVQYFISLQIIDSDESRYSSNRFETWTNWMERIRKYFHESNLKKTVFTSAGYVDEVKVPNIDPLDEKIFSIHERCVMAMVVQVNSLEPRNATGSV